MYNRYNIIDNKNNSNFIINIIDNSNDFITEICSYCTDIKIIKHLLNSNSPKLHEAHGWYAGYYPIHHLFSEQPIDNIKYIIKSKKFNIFVKDTLFDNTPLHILCWRKERKELVQIFIDFVLNDLLFTKEEAINEFHKKALDCGECNTPLKILQYHNLYNILNFI